MAIRLTSVYICVIMVCGVDLVYIGTATTHGSADDGTMTLEEVKYHLW